MKVLVVGSGGRESAIAWKLKQSKKVSEIYCAPGNAGTALIGENAGIKAEDIEGLLKFAKENKIDWTIIGPEAPLVEGIADRFESEGLKCFGPSAKAAEIEGSKVFCKQLLEKYKIPTGKFEVFEMPEKAMESIKEKGKYPIVVKADGLAAGKGVIICKNKEEAVKAVEKIMVEKEFGNAGGKIIVEEFLEGEEASFMVFTDGTSVKAMASSQDHKRIFDNDDGPNTGGMGAYSPAPVVTEEVEERIMKEIIIPTVNAMKKEGRKYKGVLYAGLMIKDGKPKILEYNCRLGDPETQAVMPRMESDLMDAIEAINEESLGSLELKWKKEAACCVVLASQGYPGSYPKGKEINGLKEAEALKNIAVFHSGTKTEGSKTVTSGGRVLGITGLGKGIPEAIEKAYEGVSAVSFEGMQFRKDIGKKALKHLKLGRKEMHSSGSARKTALISVSDKSGIIEFAKSLQELDWRIISTGGTFKALKEAGIKAVQIDEITGFPEILDGRVKTLHPAIHAGILARRDLKEHLEKIKELGIETIDLVVVNLYPFKETIEKNSSFEEAVENIDIGGPAMIRAAGKNFEGCSPIVNPGIYSKIVQELRENNNELGIETKKLLFKQAFEHTAAYDSLISNYLQQRLFPDNLFPQELSLTFRKVQECRYGENPHQKGALYKEIFTSAKSLMNFTQLHGKELSFNNFYDLNAAWNLCNEFNEPCAAIIKHTNPCGCAIAETLAEAFRKALEADPLSAFGGVIALNRKVDEETAKQLASFFNEAIIAPEFDEKSLKVLKAKKDLRIIELKDSGKTKPLMEFDFKKVESGLLVQETDSKHLSREELKFVSGKKPSEKEIEDLLFGWKIVKHVKSNAIVVVKEKQLIGTGAGQMSRVDSMKIALEKAGEKAKGAVIASDAFFPFRDNLDFAAKAGITACIETGGSIKDKEVIEAANELKVSLVFSGIRHFKH